MTYTNVQARLAALGDPSRRAIFDLLADGPLPVGEIARRLPVTRSAVSQHLRVLGDVGIVVHETLGTRNFYRLDPKAVAQIRDYLDNVWTKALSTFRSRAEKRQKVKGNTQ
jgi:DNA-binding transcriptional ArsR family regulator